MKKSLMTLALSLALAGAALADTPEEVWAAKCKSCHGATGAADTKLGKKEKVPDMTTAKWHAAHSDAEIKDVIANGSKDNKKMKAFKDKLTPEELEALVPYIRAMKK